MPDPNIPFNEVLALIKEEPQKASSAPQKKKPAAKPMKNNDGWKEDIYGEQ